MDGSEQMPPQESFQPPQDSENAKHKSRRNYLMKTLETRYDTVAGRLSDGTEIIVIPVYEDRQIHVYRLPSGGAHAVAGLLSLPSDAELLDMVQMPNFRFASECYRYCELLLGDYAADQLRPFEVLFDHDAFWTWAAGGVIVTTGNDCTNEIADTPENRRAALQHDVGLVIEWATDRKIDPACVDDAREMLDRISLDTAAIYMDDEIREDLHSALAPCDDLVFLAAYMDAHQRKHSAEFVVN
jgi:hypothetical protein